MNSLLQHAIESIRHLYVIEVAIGYEFLIGQVVSSQHPIALICRLFKKILSRFVAKLDLSRLTVDQLL